MKKKYLSLAISACLLGGLTSCNDWLDVEQTSEKKADAMFDNYDGFKGALTGCYSDMTKDDLYGARLTYSTIESLASLWYMDGAELTFYDQSLREHYYLRIHDYSHSMSEDVIRMMYSNLYNAVLETNMVIKAFADGKGTNIIDPKSRAVVEGEAYALRALFHFDLLRLFGEVPGGTRKVELPYSEVTSIDDQLTYYSFDKYVEKLQGDLDKALSLLKDNDPVFQYTLEELQNMGLDGFEHVSVEDDFMTYRQYRMNYWAAKALQARVYMYAGQPQLAHDTALEVIRATTKDGKKVVELSSLEDYGKANTIREFASPSECLFALYFDNLHDKTIKLLAGSPTFEGATNDRLQIRNSETLVISPEMKSDMFVDADPDDVRKMFMWADTKTNQSQTWPTISKYYVDESGVIPILRLSEMYLIAMEGAATLDEVNDLYYEYMVSKNVARHDYFKSMDEVKPELEKEYRRELFGEGQMFYYYKRNKTEKLWSTSGQIMTESEYILPLPNTEVH